MRHYIQSDEDFYKHIIPIQEATELGLDVESSGLDPYTATLLLIQLSTRKDTYVFNLGRVSKKLITYMIDLIKSSGKMCVGHNIKFDIKMIKHHTGIMLTNVFDTMLAEVLCYAGIGNKFYSLDYLSKKYLGIELNKETRNDFIDKTDFDFTEAQIEYSSKDVEILLSLKDRLEDNLKKRGQFKVWEEIERPLEPVVAEMEYMGVLLDQEKWKVLAEESKYLAEQSGIKLKKYLLDHFAEITKNPSTALEAVENLGITVKTKRDKARLATIVTMDDISSEVLSKWLNLNSNQQLLIVMKNLGIPVEDTNANTLKHLKRFDFINLLLEYRPSEKKDTSFGGNFLQKVNKVTGCVHAEFHQMGAIARFSSSNPNMQNIVRDDRYRTAFIARPGMKFATVDYSQIELRVAGEISQDPKFIEAYKEGKDLHAQTAAYISGKDIAEVTKSERQTGKNINFSVIYLISPHGLNYRYGIEKEDGKRYIADFFKLYSRYNEFAMASCKKILEHGFSITMAKRKRFFTVPKNLKMSDFSLFNSIKREGLNFMIQGTAAEINKLAKIYMYYENPFGFDKLHALFPVHDEIVVEYDETIEKEAVEFIEKCMKKAGEKYLKQIPVEHGIILDKCWHK